MSMKASPTVIGTFVIVGLVLLLTAVAVIGGGQLFHDKARVIVYFDESVRGLRKGSTVKFRGIDIGTVRDIRINMPGAVYDPAHVRIPVVLELDESRLESRGVNIDLGDRRQVNELVARGLRAELATESLVTGVRFVALDVRPDTRAELVNDRSVPYPEIPSIPGPIERLPERVDAILSKLADVDVAGIEESVKATVDEARALLASPHLERTVAKLDTLATSLNRTAAQLEQSARETSPLVKSAHQLLAPDGRLSNQIDATLKELASAARSLRRLSDQLSRDPGSLLRGGNE
jgi:paraquat-inducible protein B